MPGVLFSTSKPSNFYAANAEAKKFVIHLFSRRVVGWSAQSRIATDLALQALLMAVWRRKPDNRVTVHSDSHTIGASSRVV